MDGDGVIKVLLSGAHPQGDRKTLQHFIDAVTNRVQPDDFFLWPNRNQLHGGFFRFAGKCAQHGSELRLIDLDWSSP